MAALDFDVLAKRLSAVGSAMQGERTAWSSAARWVRTAGLILLVLLVASAAYILVFSRGVLNDAHRGNYRDLAVAASGLETWPGDIKRLARTNFIPDRLEKAEPSEQSEGWTYVAVLEHPDLGTLRIRYAVAYPDDPKTPCPSGEIDPQTGTPRAGRAFVLSPRAGADHAFVVAGSLLVDDIWTSDMASDADFIEGEAGERAKAVFDKNLASVGADDAATADYAARAVDAANAAAAAKVATEAKATDAAKAADAAATASATPRPVICYRVVLPFDRVVALERTGKGFSKLLITDAAGTIHAQTGSDLLPIETLQGLRSSTLNPFAAKSSTGVGEAIALDALRNPGEIEIGNDSYTVYARPFKLPGAPLPCPAPPVPRKAPVAGLSSAVATAAEAPQAPKEPAASASAATCYVVALMPEARLQERWFSPPPLIVCGFALVVLAALSLFPALRLTLIGGNEAVHGTEVTAVVAGLQIATALAVLAVLLVSRSAIERTAAREQSRTLVAGMSIGAGAEIASVVTRIKDHVSAGTETGVPLQPFSKAYPQIATSSVEKKPDAPQTLPMIETIGYFDWKGRQPPGATMVAYRKNMAARLDVGRREYFLALQHGEQLVETVDSAPLRYTADVVRAQSDGITKTVLAVAAAVTDGRAVLICDGPKSGGTYCAPPSSPPTGAFVVAALLRSFLAPVLPDPHKFLVIDLKRPDLPVLFHSERDRAGVDKFATQVADRNIVQRLRTVQADTPVEFSTRYDGQQHEFAAQAVPGTNWAVLVFHARDRADWIAATAVRRTLYLWVVLGTMALLLVFFGIRSGSGQSPWYKRVPATTANGAMPVERGRWRRFWPHDAAGEDYAALQPKLAVCALAIMLPIIILTHHIGEPGIGIVLIGIAVTVLLAHVGYRIGAREPNGRPLSPRTQRNFGGFVALLLVCIAVLPTLAFWSDALWFVSIQREARAERSMEAALDERKRQTIAIQRVFGVAISTASPRLLDGHGVFPSAPATSAVHRAAPVLFSQNLGLRDDLHTVAPPVCTGRFPGSLCAPSSSPDALVVGRGVPWQFRSVYDPSLAARLLRIAPIALLIAGLAAGLYHLGGRILRSLFGFGVPLEAVRQPGLTIDMPRPGPHDPALQEFGRKTLLVAPQQAVSDKTRDANMADLLDLVEYTANVGATPPVVLPPATWSKSRIVVFGLEMILRDPPRRRAALHELERLAALAAASNPKRSLVVISDRAPMDRILDAFEVEKQRAKDDDSEKLATQKAREGLRWARLFQDFATFNFAPVDKIKDAAADEVIAEVVADHAALNDELSAATRQGILTLIDELRWLPGGVINGAINADIHLPPAVLATGRFPVDKEAYQTAYTDPVARWACAIQPSSPAAAIDFARGAVIEHYQQCWSSSTYGERLVLDALANGRFVNFVTALSLKSLVRRGLVVLDPAPRLMSASFGMFVRQAERPETLAAWRSEQPEGGWTAARLPLGIGLAAMVVVLGVLLKSGQDFTDFLPLFAAGAPALASTVANLLKRGA